MKKTFAILFTLVFVLNTLTACTSPAPAKLMFYYLRYSEDHRLFYITQGSSEITPTPLLSKFEDQLYPNPDGSKLVYVNAILNESGDISVSLHFVYANRPEEEKVVAVPHDILYSTGEPYGFEISFKGRDTFVNITYVNSHEEASSVVVYKITGDDFIKVGEARFDQPYYFIQGNGGLPSSEKILLLSADNNDQYPIFTVYDLETGATTPATQQGNRFRQPQFSPDGNNYVYVTYVSGQVCWILNRDSVETMLICKPYDPNSDTGYMSFLSSAAWSPDMKRVAVTTTLVQESHEISQTLYLIDVTHTPQVVAEADNLERIFDVLWSPNSNMVGFSSIKENPIIENGIYTLGIDGNLRLEYTNPEWATVEVDNTYEPPSLLWFIGWLK